MICCLQHLRTRYHNNDIALLSLIKVLNLNSITRAYIRDFAYMAILEFYLLYRDILESYLIDECVI